MRVEMVDLSIGQISNNQITFRRKKGFNVFGDFCSAKHRFASLTK